MKVGRTGAGARGVGRKRGKLSGSKVSPMLQKLTAVAACGSFLLACHTNTRSTTEQTPYVIVESHASKYMVRKPLSESGVQPSTYVIRHGNVLIQAHCGVIYRSEGKYDNCESFPDPVLPIGEPLTMYRDSYGLCWSPGHYKDGVCFVIDSEKVQEVRQ
jgi:hypothetical protein